MEKNDLKPASVFQVPRPSKKEEKIRAFLIGFAQERGLAYKTDEAGNLLIMKPATPGKENLKKVVLQSHMDMVCEKNKTTEHNFDTDPIRTYVDGEWLKAQGTTLGADNGIGIATELAVLDAKDIAHGPIECLFTVDEETGLTCAGGAGTTAQFPCPMEAAPAGYFFFRVAVKGLTGGHSGDDINKGRANANKVLNRYLVQLMNRYDLRLCEIDGGNLHNAIPREAHAVCAVPMEYKEAVRVDLNVFLAEVENEYAVTEPKLTMELESETPCAEVMEKEAMKRFLLSIYAVHNGVYAMSQDMPGLVETSSNLASIKMRDGKIIVGTSQRSSILSSRKDMSQMIRAAFELGGAETTTGDGYPGWKPNPSSEILGVAVESYKRLFGVEPKIKAIHAGLECGLFLEKYPSLDMVSFGPTLRGVHSPDERMLIPTVDKFWRHLLDVLAHIPVKA